MLSNIISHFDCGCVWECGGIDHNRDSGGGVLVQEQKEKIIAISNRGESKH